MMKHSFQNQNKRPYSKNIYLKNVVVVVDTNRRTFAKIWHFFPLDHLLWCFFLLHHCFHDDDDFALSIDAIQ